MDEFNFTDYQLTNHFLISDNDNTNLRVSIPETNNTADYSTPNNTNSAKYKTRKCGECTANNAIKTCHVGPK